MDSGRTEGAHSQCPHRRRRAVNHELILLYWDMGRGIVEKQRTAGWGESVIDQISRDLQAAFPGTSGFSPRNLRSIRQFHPAYSDPAFWLQLAAKLPARKNKGNIWLQPAAKLKSSDREPFLRRLIAAIPWGHHLLLLNQLADPAARLYFLRATAQFGWSPMCCSIKSRPGPMNGPSRKKNPQLRPRPAGAFRRSGR